MAKNKNKYFIIINFSIVFGWIMSFPYEGPVMYAMLRDIGIEAMFLNAMTVLFVFVGLFTGRFASNDARLVKKIILLCNGITIILSLFVPFVSVELWIFIIPLLAFLTGIIISAHGNLLRSYIIAESRGRAVADILILGNLMLVTAHFFANNTTALLSYSIIEILLAIAFIAALGIDVKEKHVEQLFRENQEPVLKSYWILFLFIFIITINSGIMFQVIYPYFGDFELLTSLYTNVPYLLAIYVLSRFYKKDKFYLLFVGLALWGITFILFAFSEQSAISFIMICTTMLFAAGIFDLFWWSIMANSFDHVKNPSSLFGFGLSVNVLGVWVGGIIGNYLLTIGSEKQIIAFMGLFIVIISMLIILPLNNKLSNQLEYNDFIVKVNDIGNKEIGSLMNEVQGILSNRELEVYNLLVLGKTDTEISEELFITRNTIKTHNRNIYKKLNVSNRLELNQKYQKHK